MSVKRRVGAGAGVGVGVPFFIYIFFMSFFNNNSDNNKFVERHFPMVQWRFTAITEKKTKKKKLKHGETGQQFT